MGCATAIRKYGTIITIYYRVCLSAVVGGMLCKSDKPSIIIIITTVHHVGALTRQSVNHTSCHAYALCTYLIKSTNNNIPVLFFLNLKSQITKNIYRLSKCLIEQPDAAVENAFTTNNRGDLPRGGTQVMLVYASGQCMEQRSCGCSQLWHSAPPGMALGCCELRLRSTPRYRLVCICFPTPGRGLPYGSGLGLSRCLGPGECLHSFIHYISVYSKY